MALPWAAALTVEWVVLGRFFARDLRRPARVVEKREIWSRFSTTPTRSALVVLTQTLAALAASSALGIAARYPPVGSPPPARSRSTAPALPRSAPPTRASTDSLVDLLVIATLAVALANVVNGSPATRILLPVAEAFGTGPVPEVRIG